MNKDKETAQKIIQALGTTANIADLEHCSTRLRIKLNDTSIADKATLKGLDSVVAVRDQDHGLQIIIGQNVEDIYDELQNVLTNDKSKNSKPEVTAKSVENKQPSSKPQIMKKNWCVRAMNTLADCFVPLIPALIGAGLMQAVVAIIKTFGWMATSSSSYNILYIMSKAPFYFIAFLLASSVADRFKINKMITMSVVAVTLYPSLAKLAVHGSSYTSLFGIPVRLVTYSSAIVPVFLIALVQIYLEPAIKKVIPKIFSTFLNPLLEFFILSFLTLIILGPISGYIGDILAIGLKVIVGGNFKWLVDGILGGTMILLISTGLHYSLMPVVIANFAIVGYDNFFGASAFCSNMALAGAVLAFSIVAKNNKDRQNAGATGLTALLGITEPAIYGVAFVHRKVLYAALIGGGISGIVAGWMGVNAYGMAPAGLPSIALLAGPTFIHGVIAIVVAFALGFVFSLLFNGKKSIKTITKKGVKIDA
ncbi:PTS transporter subunit EIIC [Lactiplantibacillus plantarum]|uniref:PTS transporter subunit EIIC n=1 Tax=Lactiplantibacillus plantarum TaxID=1590 RepID=UPI002237BED2|nr:PTS transporter subunit EIIC [Lactiplantibacillus plantarum]MCW6128260.1 PTS transporter subunit EIIC [Lactiplantibacillus plantarum]